MMTSCDVAAVCDATDAVDVSAKSVASSSLEVVIMTLSRSYVNLLPVRVLMLFYSVSDVNRHRSTRHYINDSSCTFIRVFKSRSTLQGDNFSSFYCQFL